MWIDLSKISNIHHAYLSSIGRALTVAQHLERTARFVTNMFMILEKFESGQAKSFDDLKELKTVLDKLLLGKMVRRFEQYGEISANDIEILKIGTEARNFIAHESALFVSEYPYRPDELMQQVNILKNKVSDLVNADNLVSKWSYEIQEKEPAPLTFYQNYSHRVTAWILAPLNGTVSAG